ncbi:TetR family transcriptional regulator [Succinivibrio dextrinosolvens]|uniref:TetR family transcriptional regulator n=1 Tax=Succinivibrio dextrinosolvens TaxID=83771 RepID=UPI00241F7131|nr:TetR family transcriptional regulator [Succinivibrio dextrinosolvens]MBE6422445.1 TetR family transcriptional regulator [Succinivibrio dextrinosolvens]
MARKNIEDALETRRQILECAKRLFSNRGYERTSLSDIAKYSKVSRGAVYWHFENKEDLLISLVEYDDQNKDCIRFFSESASVSEQDPLGKLKASLMSLLNEDSSEYFNSSFTNMLIGIFNGFAGNEAAKKKLEEHDKQIKKMLSKAITNCVIRKQLPSNLDINAAAEHLALFASGFFFQSRIKNTEALKNHYSLLVEMEFEQIKRLLK